ncbi:hypothetical protein GCK72_018705 [Caenorhabditis remanei]|uniref:Sugar transporter SWEET1 n=1 Tax=Caenorhabditis remanei TaxID=31234 RepID=A0A6A5GBQ4_CAERE|nr:hypothetical protein GCK72_018705 [Caenorhabditis remanei]KAF1752151.1 hypothetical protein GCK72_018705 [Caenorhabditis remanei]
MIIQSFWLRHGLMTNDWTNIIINSLNLSVLSCYVAAYAYYQPKRKYLIGQIIGAAVIIKCAFLYVDSHDSEHVNAAMGSVAAGAQILGLGGRLYEMRRAIKMGTTEYIPAVMQFAVTALMAQWFIFGVITGNKFIAIANIAGLITSAFTVMLYFQYPPLTWTVPIFNIPPQQSQKQE